MTITVTASSIWDDAVAPAMTDPVSRTVFYPVVQKLANRDKYLYDQLTSMQLTVSGFQTNYANALSTAQTQLATAQSNLAIANAELAAKNTQILNLQGNVNLVNLASTSASYTIDGTHYVILSPSTLFDFKNNAARNRIFNGKIEKVFVLNYGLSQVEVVALMSNPYYAHS